MSEEKENQKRFEFLEKNKNKDDEAKDKIAQTDIVYDENKIIEKYDGEASIMLFNLKKIKNKNIFDENYFLYFEETDLFFRFKKNGLKVFFIKDLVISHQRASSIENETSAISNLRSWHYMWSMFYFYKKNFSYTYALKNIYSFNKRFYHFTKLNAHF